MRSPVSISPASADAPIEKICEKSTPLDDTSTNNTGQSPTSAGQLAPTELNGNGALAATAAPVPIASAETCSASTQSNDEVAGSDCASATGRRVPLLKNTPVAIAAKSALALSTTRRLISGDSGAKMPPVRPSELEVDAVKCARLICSPHGAPADSLQMCRIVTAG